MLVYTKRTSGRGVSGGDIQDEPIEGIHNQISSSVGHLSSFKFKWHLVQSVGCESKRSNVQALDASTSASDA